MPRKISVQNLNDLLVARMTHGDAFRLKSDEYHARIESIRNQVNDDLDQMSREDFRIKYADWLYGVIF